MDSLGDQEQQDAVFAPFFTMTQSVCGVSQFDVNATDIRSNQNENLHVEA